MPTKKNVTMGQALASFLAEKKRYNLSENTLATYKIHLDYFFGVLKNCHDIPCRELSAVDYNLFVVTLQNDPNKNERTVQSYCRSVRAFINWLIDNEYLEDIFKAKVPKAQKVVKATYTDEELKILLKDPRECSYATYQTWVFINFCIATGLRLSSMLDIQLKDYSQTEGTVRIQNTKNNLAQVRYLNGDLKNILDEYIETLKLNSNDYLFCKSGGGRMARRSMEDNVARYNNNRGVEKTSIHLFRHTYAKNFLQSGGSVIELQRILDHADINTTMQYVRDYGIDQKRVMELYNPQAQYTEKKVKSFNRKKKMK